MDVQGFCKSGDEAKAKMIDAKLDATTKEAREERRR